MAGGNREIIKHLKSHGVFLLILLLAGTLRFWDLANLHFSHDELSALIRTQFNSFPELINKAVRIDGHPALVQVFLYYWAPLVNYSPFYIKIPSVLLGLGSIVLIYATSLKLQRKKAGTITALILSLSTFFLYYHQVARPYAFGAFFVALAGYAYVSWFFHRKENRYLVLFAIGASLAAYSHYLALLSVLLMGISALVRSRKNPKPWLLVGFGVLASFAPHWGIFWDQLQLGGVGQWLAAPDALWIGRFFSYLFNYQAICLGLGLGLILISLTNKNQSKKFPESWIWFLACFLIAFAYSIFRDPLLRYSSLIFLSPFLFIAPLELGHGYKRWLLVLLFFMSFAIYDREYFQKAQLNPPKVAEAYLAEQEKELPVYYHWSDEKWDFYRKIDSGIPSGTFLKKDLSPCLSADEFLLLCDHASPAYWPLQLLDNAYVPKKIDYHFGFSLYHFSRDRSQAKNPLEVHQILDSTSFKTEAKQYQRLAQIETKPYFFNNTEASVVVDLQELKGEGGHLIFQLMEGEVQKGWFAYPLKNGSNYFSRPISDLKDEYHHWNILLDQGAEARAHSGRLRIRWIEGNSKIYGLEKNFK